MKYRCVSDRWGNGDYDSIEAFLEACQQRYQKAPELLEGCLGSGFLYDGRGSSVLAPLTGGNRVWMLGFVEIRQQKAEMQIRILQARHKLTRDQVYRRLLSAPDPTKLLEQVALNLLYALVRMPIYTAQILDGQPLLAPTIWDHLREGGEF